MIDSLLIRNVGVNSGGFAISESLPPVVSLPDATCIFRIRVDCVRSASEPGQGVKRARKRCPVRASEARGQKGPKTMPCEGFRGMYTMYTCIPRRIRREPAWWDSRKFFPPPTPHVSFVMWRHEWCRELKRGTSCIVLISCRGLIKS